MRTVIAKGEEKLRVSTNQPGGKPKSPFITQTCPPGLFTSGLCLHDAAFVAVIVGVLALSICVFAII